MIFKSVVDFYDLNTLYCHCQLLLADKMCQIFTAKEITITIDTDTMNAHQQQQRIEMLI